MTIVYDPSAMYRFDDGLLPYVGSFPAADLGDATSLAATRRQVTEAIAERDVDWSGVSVTTELAGTAGADAATRVAVYRPTDIAGPWPVMVYFHGGGFVLADERSEDPLLTRLVRELGIAIVSVGYRLAPEHPCPAALDDGCTALHWCAETATAQGFDPDRLGVGGRSAGAALAAGVALATGDAIPLRFLYLGEPVLDPRLATASMREMDDTPVWRRRDAEQSWALYLGGRGLAELPSYAAPATHTPLDGLPPTYLTANEIDPLRDEAVAFLTRLLAAGVPTEFHLYPGAFHGAMSFAAPLAERMFGDLAGALRRGLVDGY